MGITIGDALVVVGGLAAVCLSAWSTMIVLALLFPSRSRRAQEAWEARPWKSLLLGLVGWLIGVLGLVLIQIPIPLIKLLGFILLGATLCVAALGSAGLCLLLCHQINGRDSGYSGFISLVRSATFIVLMSMLPLLGWFFLGPVMFTMALGAGLSALFGRSGYLSEASNVATSS